MADPGTRPSFADAATRIERLCVVGLGLIGGSLARDLRRLGLVGEVVGCGRGRENLQRGMDLGVIDRFEHDPAKAVVGADMVVVAVPLGAMKSVFGAIFPALDEGAVVTDVGSAKRSVIEAAVQALGEVPPRFVAGHPIAGTERSGVEAALDGLFCGRRVILTPRDETDIDAVQRVAHMWRDVGAELIEMSPQRHDEVLAATSHLPHLLAYTLVDVLGQMEQRAEFFKYAAGGFRDFTRIASSDPQMWHDICLANSDAVLASLRQFEAELHELGEAIERGDGERLHEMFTRSKQLRDRFVEQFPPSAK